MVGIFWNVALKLVARVRATRIIVVCQVGSRAEAQAVEQTGAQVLIAQGVEAGGDVRGDRSLHELVPEIVAETGLPVLAAGGLVDGADLATVLSLGAQGAVFGTALIAAPESFAHSYNKQRLVDADDGDTVLTDVFHISWPRGTKVRVLANSVTRGERGDPYGRGGTVIGDDAGRPIYLFSTDSPLRSMTGEFEAMALYAGAGVDRVTAIVGAADRVRGIAAEASRLLNANADLPSEPVELTSPACLVHEMHDRYMGFAALDELLPALNELLEAERAGAHVTLTTAKDIEDGALKRLVMVIHRDEARWCGVLTRGIHQLQGAPSPKTGAFYDKAMAISDIADRPAFLNRGRGWVVRKLKALLSKVRDERLHGDLSAMLASHERNLDLVGSELPTPHRIGAPS